MSGVFKNLVCVARGEMIPGAARVALPPRFAATTPAARDIDFLPPQERLDATPSPPRDHPQLQTIAAAGDPTAPPSSPPTSQTQFSLTEQQPTVQASLEPKSASIKMMTAPLKVTADIEQRPPLNSDNSLRHTLPQNAVHRDVSLAHNDTSPSVPAPPLNDVVLAGQSLRRRETPPVIQVTIDRIDIRSPEPPRSVGVNKTPPKPSVSLSDYLRRPSTGGRA